MTLTSGLLQILTGLASASTLFLVASGLSLIFGVTRIVNFAHGSFYMIGLYAAVALAAAFGAGPSGFWGGVLLAALAVAALGAAIEMLVLRRLYAAPELYQLLATFALVLVIRDAALWAWGAEDILGPRAPGMKGAVSVFGLPFPSYDVFLIFVGPAVLGLLWLLLTRTRWGLLVRAATQDREMVGALGGMGSIVGAFVAAVLIAMVKAVCIAAGSIDVFGASFPLSKLTLVAEFLVMAVVLVWRPWGLV